MQRIYIGLLGMALLAGCGDNAGHTQAVADSPAAQQASAQEATTQQASVQKESAAQAPTQGDMAMVQDGIKDCIPGDRLPGGWHRQEEVSDDARAALDTVLRQMNTAARLKDIREVRTQVVAGLNYAIEFELDNGEVWHTKVYRDLKGHYSMKDVAVHGPLLPLCPR
ncbi:cystatin domain-containing protein [Shewanella khirikhana]|uniref:cystatin domain-containing protein n=1 Tax=Shewanella khirikhana TaxID=1965282 RepID=UPI0030D53655